MTLRIEDIARTGCTDLTDGQLLELVRRVAAFPKLWAEHVHHDPLRRTYKELLRDEHLDVWLLCWSRDHDTGFHDHDLSAGAVAVAQGSVREDRLALGRPIDEPISRIARAGSSFSFGAADIHRVLHAGEGPAVTKENEEPAAAIRAIGSSTERPSTSRSSRTAPWATATAPAERSWSWKPVS